MALIGDDKVNRALFCFGVLPAFYDAGDDVRRGVFNTLLEAYKDLETRFGVKVLGTLDDDRTVVGPATAYPWTCYILAEVPDYDSVAKVCNILREYRVGDQRLWSFMKVEARYGRELFFGQS
jgi:hypothetical protein